MSAPIGPGDWVEAIKPIPELSIAAGTVHRVLRLKWAARCWHCGSENDGAELVGYPDDGWIACPDCELRPIYRPKSDLIEQLKQPAPDAVRELEDA